MLSQRKRYTPFSLTVSKQSHYFTSTHTHTHTRTQTQKLVEAFTNTEATVDAYKGGLFSILGGQITGEFVECVRPSKIVQKWRLKTWPDGK